MNLEDAVRVLQDERWIDQCMLENGTIATPEQIRAIVARRLDQLIHYSHALAVIRAMRDFGTGRGHKWDRLLAMTDIFE